MFQHEGGCVQCGEPRTLTPMTRFGATTQINLICDSGNKVVVGLCEKCYKAAKFDFDKIKTNLIASEKDWAAKRGFTESASDIENMEIKGFEIYLR